MLCLHVKFPIIIILCRKMLCPMTGDSQENVVRLCQHADLCDADRTIIKNMRKIGVPIILEVCLVTLYLFIYLRFILLLLCAFLI